MPRNGAPTRERILDAAQRLFIDNGYSATTVDEVIAAAESSKGAFFHHFESKRALAEALVDRYVASDLAMLDAGLAAAAEAGADPVGRAIAFLRFYEGNADEIMAGTTGCLYTTVLAESQLIAAGASDPISKAVVVWRERFAELLEEAFAVRPDRRGELSVDALSDHLFVTFEGAFLLARTAGDPAHMRAQLRTLRILVQSLLT